MNATRNKTELAGRMARYVELRLEGKTNAQAAAALGIVDRTARKYAADARVQAALRAGRDELVRDAANKAATVIPDGLEHLLALAKNEDTPPGVRVTCWRVALDTATKVLEAVDLVDRVARLEEALSEKTQPGAPGSR